MRKTIVPVALFLSLALTASQAIAAEVRYSITDLGTTTTPLAINNNGQVVGSVAMEDGNGEAFVYQNGVLTMLGAFSGTASVATGINNSGSIAGTFTTISGDSHGFLYKNGLTDLFSAAGLIEAKAVNDSGVVLGLIKDLSYFWPAWQTVLYDDGLLTNISLAEGGYPDYSHPVAVNNAGQAVYYAWICSDCDNSYFYSDGRVKEYVWFEAADLNDSGDLVGVRRSFGYGQGEVGLWYHDGEETVLNDLPESDNYPRAINNKRQIVGTALYNDVTHAFLYSDSKLADLNTLLLPGSGWVLAEATDINDNGEILGFGKFQGDWHAYLLQPWQKVELEIITKVDTERLDSKRLLKAAILGSPDFDPATVNPETIRLAGAAVNAVGPKTDLRDVNQDGRPDLIFRVPISDMNIGVNGSSTRVVLEAQTFDGQKIGGEANLVYH